MPKAPKNAPHTSEASLPVTPGDVASAAAAIRDSVIVTECDQSRTLSETIRRNCESTSSTIRNGFSAGGDGGTQDLKYGPTPLARTPSKCEMKIVHRVSVGVTEMFEVAA